MHADILQSFLMRPLRQPLVRRAIATLVPTGVPAPIVYGPLRGLRWITGSNAGPNGGLSVFANGYERHQLAAAVASMRPSDTFFDIGANVGLYTLLFGASGARVFSFEPNPRNISFLQRHIVLNGLTSARIVPVAVSDEPGLARFGGTTDHSMGSITPTGIDICAKTTVDAFVHATGFVPTVMKIDVEGSELDVLRGARSTLSGHRPNILLSVHSATLRAQCLDFLSSVGYGDIRPVGSANLDNSDEFVARS